MRLKKNPMLTNKQKAARFKAMQNKNYRASLKLEGFELDGAPGTEPSSEPSVSEYEQIARLKKHYAR
ncbi:YhfG family protein [Photobacterium sp. SP02]|uniref:YhfG family protein n=1 Tax=Photobacterium sp. SP02 TaxID=3032280 RepID=UPI00406D4165